jgi:hypothetical protein
VSLLLIVENLMTLCLEIFVLSSNLFNIRQISFLTPAIETALLLSITGFMDMWLPQQFPEVTLATSSGDTDATI